MDMVLKLFVQTKNHSQQTAACCLLGARNSTSPCKKREYAFSLFHKTIRAAFEWAVPHSGETQFHYYTQVILSLVLQKFILVCGQVNQKQP